MIGAWRSVGDAPLDRGTLDVLRADDYLNRTYARGATSAELFVAYYATQRQGDTMHSPMNCLPAAGWQPLATGRVQVDVGSPVPIEVNRYVIQKGLDQRLVLYWYQAHGRTIASEYASKAYLVFDSLRLHRSDAALVRVIAPLAGSAMQADQAIGFVKALYPVLAGYIPS
jgi:EpsI family protein